MKKQKKPSEEETSFEKAMGRLEEIIQNLESGDQPLEETLSLYEEGVRLTRVCSGKLDQAEKRIEILTRDGQGDIKVTSGNSEDYRQKFQNGEDEGEAG